MRPSTLYWIAYRDLISESKGKRAWLIMGLSALLMAPISYAPGRTDDVIYERSAGHWTLTGDFDRTLLVQPQFSEGRPNTLARNINFIRQDGVLVVKGLFIPDAIREHLNHTDPHPIAIHYIAPVIYTPGRSSLLALISAAVLTGAVTESLAGERTRKTLDSLLSAAITRRELIYGKWLAWSGYGACTGLFFALVSIALGRIEVGIWLCVLPTVPMALTAFGLYIVRHAEDVLSGATSSLRWLPVTIGASTLLSWWFSAQLPFFAAAVPIGGAILASGELWSGYSRPIVAIISTLSFSVFFLEQTVADLVPRPHAAHPIWDPLTTWAKWTGLAAIAWQTPLLAATLWRSAGNPLVGDEISVASRLFASSLSLGLLLLFHLVHSPSTPALRSPKRLQWLAASVLALLLFFALPIDLITPLSSSSYTLFEAGRLPSGGPIGVLVIVTQELLFRWLLPGVVGPIAALIAWVLVVSPHDPLGGLLMGLGLMALARWSKSIAPGVAARALLLMG